MWNIVIRTIPIEKQRRRKVGDLPSDKISQWQAEELNVLREMHQIV